MQSTMAERLTHTITQRHKPADLEPMLALISREIDALAYHAEISQAYREQQSGVPWGLTWQHVADAKAAIAWTRFERQLHEAKHVPHKGELLPAPMPPGVPRPPEGEYTQEAALRMLERTYRGKVSYRHITSEVDRSLFTDGLMLDLHVRVRRRIFDWLKSQGVADVYLRSIAQSDVFYAKAFRVVSRIVNGVESNIAEIGKPALQRLLEKLTQANKGPR